MRQVFGTNQTDVLWCLYRREKQGYVSADDVEHYLWDTDPIWRSRDPRQGARRALKRLVELGLVHEDYPYKRYRLTAEGRAIVRRWEEATDADS